MSKYDMGGFIGKNQFKKSDKHPDITGKCTIDGVQYEIAGWMKESTGDHGGSKYYSLKFQLPREKKDRNDLSDIESDIPW